MSLLITGASGLLGAYLLREAQHHSAVVGWSGHRRGERFGFTLQPVDLADPGVITAAFRAARPTLVLHAAAISSAAVCLADPASAQRINVEATSQLASLAAEAGVRFVYVSTDMVFDGARGGYQETDPPAPLSVYGRTKAQAESVVLSRGGVVARVSLLFGPSLADRPGYFDQQVDALRTGKPCALFEDEWRTPVSFLQASRWLLALVDSQHTGIFHLGGCERMSRLDMGRRLAAYLGCRQVAILPTSRLTAPGEPRPGDLSLDSTRWRTLFPGMATPGFEEALGEMGLLLSGGP